MKPIILVTAYQTASDNDAMRDALECRRIIEGYEIAKTVSIKNLGWLRSHFRDIDLDHPTPVEIVVHRTNTRNREELEYFLFVHLTVNECHVMFGCRFMDLGLLREFVTNARNLRGIRIKDYQKGYSYLNNMPDEERISLLTDEKLRVNT
jgi:hypothetical protein